MGSAAGQGEIRSCEDRRFEAMVAADLPSLGRLLGDDLVYTHSGASVDTKASLIEGIAVRAARLRQCCLLHKQRLS